MANLKGSRKCRAPFPDGNPQTIHHRSLEDLSGNQSYAMFLFDIASLTFKKKIISHCY